jgi:SAM-dependent methyltransferase
MSKRDHDIYASAPMKGLLAEEMAALMPMLQRCAGTRGLLVSAAPGDVPPALPLLGYWTRLRLAGARLDGDVRASPLEPLPFIDGTFDLVLLRHALEMAPLPPALLADIIRCLAPGGVLALTGLHPFGGWSPWWHWRMRGVEVHLNSPLQLGSWLRRADLQVERVQRVGRLWPGPAVDEDMGPHSLGGGYVLLARKRRSMSQPIRLRPHPVPARARTGLASEARRSSAA